MRPLLTAPFLALGLLLAVFLQPLAAVGAGPDGSSAAPLSTAAGEPASGFAQRLRGWLQSTSNGADELLPPDEAFQLRVRALDARRMAATLTPAPAYYLYRDRISFAIEDPPGLQVERVALPAGVPKQDPNFGLLSVYKEPVEAVVHLSGPANGPLRLRVSYQGCNEPRGVCYPPIEKVVTVQPAGLSAPAEPVAATRFSEDRSETEKVRSLFQGGTLPLLAAFFGLGVLLAFTPCMLPMIPILTGIVVGQAGNASRWRTVSLCSSYVLGMALTYAAVGVAAGMAGALVSMYMQAPPVRIAFAAVFVALALAMFGLFRFQLPAGLQSRVAAVSSRLPGGRYTTVFAMGALSALIVGTCVAAPLAGALLYISQTRDAVLGGMSLFAMALGMGLPLLVIGATAGSLLRRAGPWAAAVQRFFGFVMLGIAIYLVSPVVPLAVQQVLWGALLIVAAMFVHAIDPLPAEAPAHRRFFKGVGVISLLVGVASLAGALAGSPDLLRPLGGLRQAGQTPVALLPFRPVRSLEELDTALRQARGREVMVDFWAEWCVSCAEMDRFTFTDPAVRARLDRMVLLRVDVTRNTPEDQALLRRFGLFGPPGTIFYDAAGTESPRRVIGYEAPQAFLASVRRALGADRPIEP